MNQPIQVLGTHSKQSKPDVDPCFFPLLALFGLFGNRNKFGGNNGAKQNMNPWQQQFGSPWAGQNWPMQGMGMMNHPFFQSILGNRMNAPSKMGNPWSSGMRKSWPFMF